MRFDVNRNHLAQAVALLAGVAPKKPSKPLARFIRLSGTGTGANMVQLTATDMDTALTMNVPASIVRPGVCLVDPAKLLPIAKLARGDEVSICREVKNPLADDEKTFYARSGRAEWDLIDEPTDLYPQVPEAPAEAPRITILCRELIRAIEATAYAVESKAVGDKYALEGCLFETDGTELRLVSTNGRRLALITVPLLKPAPPIGFQAVVNATALRHLVKAIARAAPEEPCELVLTRNGLWVQTELARFWARLVEKRFPRWQDIFTTVVPTTILAYDSPELPLQMFRLASITTSDEAVGASVEIGDDEIHVWSEAADVGRAHIKHVFEHGLVPCWFRVDPSYLIEALAPIKGELELRIWNAKSAVEIRSGTYRALVMPLGFEADDLRYSRSNDKAA